MENEENQKQVFHRFPQPLEIAKRDFHIPTAAATKAMEKWKSKNRIPTFPRQFPIDKKGRKENSPERRLTPPFRLILGLEYAG